MCLMKIGPEMNFSPAEIIFTSILFRQTFSVLSSKKETKYIFIFYFFFLLRRFS